ncbi:TetR/AcrR family transcriptional regulator, partial [Enterococcus faecium]|uniref:TetR/AcrR family transcriptional regulator n=4 Tax=Enterococcus TaxID=1350 RepID=UPI000CBB0306
MQQLDLRVQKTHKALIEAFENLLHEKEFENISVTEICDAAMVRRPTFYNHFLDKYDFITFFIKHKINEIFDFAIKN